MTLKALGSTYPDITNFSATMTDGGGGDTTAPTISNFSATVQSDGTAPTISNFSATVQ